MFYFCGCRLDEANLPKDEEKSIQNSFLTKKLEHFSLVRAALVYIHT
jgi:hypothetical protein